MITGTVNANLEAVIPLMLHNIRDTKREIHFLVDTGYDGWLSLSKDLISELGLIHKRVGQGILADGTEKEFDVYELTVVWDGISRTVQIHEIETVPLMGMSLISGYELIIQAREGGTVTLRLL